MMASALSDISTQGNAGWVSRRGTAYKGFPQLSAAIGAAIPGQAVLDGEIVHLDAEGKPRFYDLMRRRTPQHYYAFDLLWLDGRDLRELPLIERKRSSSGSSALQSFTRTTSNAVAWICSRQPAAGTWRE